MAETTKPGVAKGSFVCGVHGVQSGTECPICAHFANPPDPAAPMVEPEVDFRDHVKEFWRGYGKWTLGAFALACVVSMFPYTITKPLGYDPVPHRPAITELESVLFYEGATDLTQHPQMVASLFEALQTSVERDPATFQRAELIEKIKGLRDQVRVQAPGAYRLSLSRQGWLSLRVSFFEPAVWFRSTSAVVDRLQAKVQGAADAAANQTPENPEGEDGPVQKTAPPPASAQALLAMLTEYERAIERYATRAGNLTLQRCDPGAALADTSGQLASLVIDTREELAKIIGDDPTARQRLGSVISQGESVMRARNSISCQSPVPPSQIYSRELATFQQYARDTRRNIEAYPPGS